MPAATGPRRRFRGRRLPHGKWLWLSVAAAVAGAATGLALTRGGSRGDPR
jgi:hypothetical protein